MVLTNGGIKTLKKRPDQGKTIVTIIVLNLFEMALIACVLLYMDSAGGGLSLLSNPWVILLLLAILTAVVLNSLFALKNRANLLRTDYQFQLLQDSLSRLENLNNTLRAQRHDFLNHLQVVYSLMEMDEFKSATEYIEKVYNDIQKVSRVLKTSNPAVNALLQAKLINCEKAGIAVDLNVTTQLKDLKIPSWEFCRVLGNLLDNAIYALREKKHDMNLKVELSEDLKSYFLKVIDNGSPIPADLLEKIFEPGFTTKGERGEGMGLAIGREIMKSYGGTLQVTSNSETTTFEACVPRLL